MKYDKLPQNLKNPTTKFYYDRLKKKKVTFFFKRLFDFIMSLCMIVILSPILLILSILILCTSKGPILYKQKRVTRYGKIFRIWKFRTMVRNADKIGTQVTIHGDPRITKVGKFLRKYRLDELPQLFNILFGQMSFVGPRPEVEKYVNQYQEEMYATLLVRSGVTSLASIRYKDEGKLLENAQNADEVYVNEILPEKMKYNYQYLEKINIFYDSALLFQTVIAVLKR